MASKRLTDIGTATGITLSDFVHIVITGDTSQNPAGSSYKASLQQIYDVFNIENLTGNMWHVPSGTTLTIEDDYQHFIYGDMLVEGYIQLSGNSQLVVLNGDLIISGGTVEGTGNIYNVQLPTLDTKVSDLVYTGSVLTLYQNDGSDFSVTINTSNDLTITGGTYDNTTGVATFYNNVGSYFGVTGFFTGSSIGNIWYLPSGQTLTVEDNRQHFIYGDMLVEGLIQLNGASQLVVLNGDLIISGGTINGTGTVYNIQLPIFDTKVNNLGFIGNDLVLTQNDGSSFTATTPTSIGKYTTTLVSPSATTYTITHNLGTDDVIVQLWLQSTPNELIGADIQNVTATDVDVVFGITPTNDVKVVIIG